MLRAQIKRSLYIGLAMLGLAACQSAQGPQKERFVIYYGSENPKAPLDKYELLVFHPNAEILPEDLAPKQVTLAYISIGEAVSGMLSEKDQQALALRKHDYWDSYLIDVRQPRWREMIVHEYVPNALAKGYDGVMIDTADSPLYLENTEPQTYRGMRAATIDLVKAIRQTHPQGKIMMNRGFEIWPHVASEIDMLLVESTLSHYDLEKNRGSFAAKELYQQQLEKISTIRRLHPHLKVYSIDYWDMNDTRGVAAIYQAQRANGMIPYVARPSLSKIHPEPEDAFEPKSSIAATLGERDA